MTPYDTTTERESSTAMTDTTAGDELATDGGQPSGQAVNTPTGEQSNTASGLEPNVAGAAAYALGWLTGLFFFFTEKDDEFVRFHAAQSIVAFGALTVIYFVVSNVLLGMFVATAGFGMWQLFSLLNTLLGLAGLALWLGMMYMAYQGRWYELPIAGGIARNLIANDSSRTVERKPPQ